MSTCVKLLMSCEHKIAYVVSRLLELMLICFMAMLFCFNLGFNGFGICTNYIALFPQLIKIYAYFQGCPWW